jgi:hypothetical protein
MIEEKEPMMEDEALEEQGAAIWAGRRAPDRGLSRSVFYMKQAMFKATTLALQEEFGTEAKIFISDKEARAFDSFLQQELVKAHNKKSWKCFSSVDEAKKFIGTVGSQWHQKCILRLRKEENPDEDLE